MDFPEENLTTQLRAALRIPAGDGGGVAMTATLRGRHPADIADAMRELNYPESLAVFQWLDNARAAEALDELDAERSRYILDHAPPGRIADLLDRLPMDDAAEVVAEALETTPERAEELLDTLAARSPTDAAEVRTLLSYKETSAGRLMTDKYLRLSAAMTVEEAFTTIRRSGPEIETLTDLYVVEHTAIGGRRGDRLIGLINLRGLVRADPAQNIADVMVKEPLTVTVDTDRQEVARLIAKYDFLAMPVLDRDGFLAGIITVDDVIDVLVAEFNEDYLRLVGSDAEEMEQRTPMQVARLRLPWLLGTMLIEFGAALIISRYDEIIKQVTLLAAFMPIVSAISGNVGLQAAAIVVRGLETGHVRLETWQRSLFRELATALIMATVCGSLLGTIGALWNQHLVFGLVVGGAMTCSMLTAALLGTLIPMLSRRLGFDPATTAGPFETAVQDVVGFGVFFLLTSLFKPWLLS